MARDLLYEWLLAFFRVITMRALWLISVMAAFFCSQTQADSFPIRLGLSKSSGDTLYVNALLANKVPARFMIDTGSSVVVLNQQTFDKLKASGSRIVKTSEMGARLASGRIRVVQRYQIDTLTLDEGCEFNDVEVAVMKKSNNILGMSVLSAAAPFAIFTQPAELGLSQCDMSSLQLAGVDHGQ